MSRAVAAEALRELEAGSRTTDASGFSRDLLIVLPTSRKDCG